MTRRRRPGFVRCPGCGRFLAYMPHVGGWQCQADGCGRMVRSVPAADASPAERLAGQEQIRRALRAMMADGGAE